MDKKESAPHTLYLYFAKAVPLFYVLYPIFTFLLFVFVLFCQLTYKECKYLVQRFLVC